MSSFSKLVPESLNRPVLYANLASFLQAAYEAVRSAPEPATAAPPAAPPGAPPVAGATPYTGDDSRLAVHCLDEPFPTGDAPFLEAVNSWPRQAPTTGATHAVSQLACGHWPARDRNRYAGPWNRRTPTPVLLVGNYRDPATNYVFSQRMAAALGNARLVSVDAFGHTILGHSACADAITTRYLTDLTVPPPGVVCQPDRQPFD